MQLNQEEIDYVKQFIVEKKYIYVEEKVEVLDHFISLLEDAKSGNSIVEFKVLVSTAYEENKADLISIQKSVEKNLKKTYNKIFRQNILSQFTSKYLFIFLLGAGLYFWFLILIRDHISILTVFLPHVIFLPLSVIDCRRKFTLAKGKFLSGSILSRYLIWWSGLQMLPCNLILGLGSQGSIDMNISFILISSILMIQVLVFRAFIKTVLISAKECKMMEENYQLINS